MALLRLFGLLAYLYPDGFVWIVMRFCLILLKIYRKVMENKDIMYEIIGACMRIRSELGPGLLEQVYKLVLAHELIELGFKVETEREIPLVYKGVEIGNAFRADIVVEDSVIVELKSVENLNPVWHKQLATYMRLSGIDKGILVNFSANDFGREGIYTRR